MGKDSTTTIDPGMAGGILLRICFKLSSKSLNSDKRLELSSSSSRKIDNDDAADEDVVDDSDLLDEFNFDECCSHAPPPIALLLLELDTCMIDSTSSRTFSIMFCRFVRLTVFINFIKMKSNFNQLIEIRFGIFTKIVFNLPTLLVCDSLIMFFIIFETFSFFT